MTIFVKTNGNWETVNEVYFKENGSWVPVNQVWYRNEAQALNVPPLAPFVDYFDFYLNVFSSPLDPAYLFDEPAWIFTGGSGLLDPDPLYPGGGSGTIQVPYGCNRAYMEIRGQGGAGAASSAFPVVPGAGGSGAIIETDVFSVTEFEPINWSVSSPNTIATGDGGNGADVTISWAGNTLVAGGGQGGFMIGTHGNGGTHSGSGPVYTAATKYDGIAGGNLIPEFNKPWERGGGLFAPGNIGGGIYYAYGALGGYIAEGNPIAPSFGGGGGAGFNSYGQRGGGWAIYMFFYYEP